LKSKIPEKTGFQPDGHFEVRRTVEIEIIQAEIDNSGYDPAIRCNLFKKPAAV